MKDLSHLGQFEDRFKESSYEYDGLGRITKVTTGSGEITTYQYGVNDLLETLTYPDGKSVHYEYDKNDNLTQVTDRTGAVTTYVYDAINRITEIHRPNGISTYNTYNARDQIVTLKNICDGCGWVVSQYDYTYDDRGFIVGETALESLYGYAWDDKHDGKHENGRHDDEFPHGGQHTNKHDKDGEYNFQIVETKRTFTYDEDGKLLTATENEEQQGRYDYVFEYDDMGNRTYYGKSRNGTLQESGEYTYNAANQLLEARSYDGKKHTTLTYTYDADGNRISETGKIGTDKVENTYIYTVENRLKAVYDADELLAAMAYDGDGNRIFQLNYNLHTDDDTKGNNGNGNGNNKDNSGSGNNGNDKSVAEMILDVLGLGEEETEDVQEQTAETTAETAAAVQAEETATAPTETAEEIPILEGIPELAIPEEEPVALSGLDVPAEEDAAELDGTEIELFSTDKKNDNGNNGNNGNGGNGNHYGWDKTSDSKAGNDENGSSGNNGNDNENSDNKGNANGNTNNTGGSQNQSGILFPEAGEVSELEQEMIDMIKTEGKHKNYELIEYVNDVNREYTEVLMELNINGIMDTAYSYGNERLTVERFDGWTGYYTYDPRGSVSGVTGADGYLWQSYRYDAYGNITFGAPQYNNEYTYNAESYNPNLDMQYLRARYYSPSTANFLTEDSYLGDISDPLTLNRYNYVKGSPLNYIDPSGHIPDDLALANRKNLQKNVSLANSSDAKRANERITGQTSSESAKRELNEKQRKAWNYIKDLIQKAQDKTNDFVISCESYVAGVKVKINQKNSEFSVFILLLFGEDPSGEENRAKQYRNQTLEGLEEIDYTSFEAGYIDGDWYYLLMFYDMVSAGMAGVNAVNNSLGSGGVLVTAEGVEIPGAGVVSGAEEGIASVSGGIITGLLAALGAAGDPEGGSGKGDSGSDLGNYEFKEGIDEDLRGGKGTFEEALEKAFEKTGTPKEDFTVTKWGKDQYGKSHPVEWRASNGAEVSIDIGHSVESGAPTADHVGWQTGGKRSSGGGVRGHIFVDEVPYNR